MVLMNGEFCLNGNHRFGEQNPEVLLSQLLNSCSERGSFLRHAFPPFSELAVQSTLNLISLVPQLYQSIENRNPGYLFRKLMNPEFHYPHASGQGSLQDNRGHVISSSLLEKLFLLVLSQSTLFYSGDLSCAEVSEYYETMESLFQMLEELVTHSSDSLLLPVDTAEWMEDFFQILSRSKYDLSFWSHKGMDISGEVMNAQHNYENHIKQDKESLLFRPYSSIDLLDFILLLRFYNRQWLNEKDICYLI